MGDTSYTPQAIMLATVPKIPSVLSIIGSAIIVRSVLRSRAKRSSVYHRLMVGLSTSDILSSSVYFLGTILIPRGTVGRYGPVFWASGTTGTCHLSGFFTQFALSSPLYNATCALYFLLRIHFKWSEKRLLKIEPLMHAVPFLAALATASAAVILRLYGSVDWLCWINPDPPREDTKMFQWAFLFLPIWICFAFVSAVMLSLWWSKRRQEKQNEESAKLSRRIAVQGMLYVGAFYITWFFPSLQRIIERGWNKKFFPLEFLDATLLPLQGLFNCLIFLRPRYQAHRKRYPEMTFGQRVAEILGPEEDGDRRSSQRGASQHHTSHRESSQLRQSSMKATLASVVGKASATRTPSSTDE